MIFVRLFTLGSLLFFLHSCSFLPAELKKIVNNNPLEKSANLPTLLATVLEDNQESSEHALAHFVEKWKQEDRGSTGTLQLYPNQEPWTVKFVTHSSTGNFELEHFDKLFPAEDFEVTKIKHFKREGVGAPLVGFSENYHQKPIDRFYPPEGISRALTAYAKKTGKREVSIQLYSPLHNETLPDQKTPLAGDFSVPWAAVLERTGSLWRTGITDVLSRSSRPPQLYLVEAYDPNKEPLLMIHGLFSNQIIWAKISNELWSEREIRSRYQIWHYRYDTSAPALYSARQLRNQIKEVRQLLDPKGKDLASRHMTLLTHSMGGLVGKSLVLEPKDAFWKAAFNIPHQQLKLSDEDRKVLGNAFEWTPEKSIGRIIFSNVPHGGSNYADNFIGRLGRLIAAPPQPFTKFYQRISKDNPGVFTPSYEALGNGKLDGIGSLSTKQPTLTILNRLRAPHPVIFHSIIGDRGREGPLEESSDGVVAYHSSHYPSAVSEKVVPYGHGAFEHHDAVDEIKRILKIPRGKKK